MQTQGLVYILLFPLIGTFINGFLSFFRNDLKTYFKKNFQWSAEKFSYTTNRISAIVGVLAVTLSFLCGVWYFFELLNLSSENALSYTLLRWIHTGALDLEFSFYFDHLSSIMVLVVTGVGSLIHLYSVGYMHGDPGVSRYFAYLNLFIVAMLMLVLGNNLLVMFIGWEGVGLVSYLLISFWYSDIDKAKAGKKAFIVNRMGDVGFVLGALLLFALFNTMNFSELTQSIEQSAVPVGYITCAALLLFFGACGKSAQIPLYVWLPDAMAGPTPVSALIHAATMVTAGVYMVVRLSPLYFAAPYAMNVIAIIGAATALFAATIGLVQKDIKKILAYSTISQLGFMFLACGVGAPIAAIFHLVTHAFFKACLFLGAGSVIHGMGGEQDITRMGGLKHKMPVTFWTFLIAILAISGFPPFSGFMSKDEILVAAFGTEYGSMALGIIAVIAALFTSLYMFRLFYLTFLGDNRSGHKVYEHVHESPGAMTSVLIILAGLAMIGGFIGIPHLFSFLAFPNLIEEWLEPVVISFPLTRHGETLSPLIMLVSVGMAFLGLLIAYIFYGRKNTYAENLRSLFQTTYQLLWHKYFVDEIYHKLIVRPLYFISERILFNTIEKGGIDWSVDFAGRFSKTISRKSLKLQQGDIQYYLLYMIIGLIIMSVVILWWVQ